MKRETIPIVRAVIFVSLMALFTAAASAEQKLVYGSAEGSTIRVDGRSTAHHWTVTGRQIDGTIEFPVALSPGASREQIRQALIANPNATALLAIPAHTLRGGEKAMDNPMYDALRAKKDPEITYKLEQVSGVAGGDARAASFELQTTGELTIAGTTRTLDMPMTLEVLDERRLKISARTVIRMSDYKVERPQALGGLIKADDKVVVDVAWVVANSDRPVARAQE